MGAIKMPIGKNNWDVKAYRNKLENESMKHQKKLGEPEAAPGKKSLHFFLPWVLLACCNSTWLSIELPFSFSPFNCYTFFFSIVILFYIPAFLCSNPCQGVGHYIFSAAV